MDVKEEFSVAAIVYNNEEYLLLKYGLGHWEFVKGHKEQGETDDQTILRELKEETGLIDVTILEGFKEKYDYFFSKKDIKIHKYVICYLIESREKTIKLSFEHVNYAWLPFHKAIKRLTYNNAKELLNKAKSFRKSPLRSFLELFLV